MMCFYMLKMTTLEGGAKAWLYNTLSLFLICMFCSLDAMHRDMGTFMMLPLVTHKK